MLSDRAIITAGAFSAEIATAGAELQRLTHQGFGELLWDGDPAFWSGRAPILFPVVGALAGNRYHYEGRDYPLEKHGFARRNRWETVAAEADAVTFRLDPDDRMRVVYPFEFRLELRFALANDALTMAATLGNLGDVPMPASFGFHPALRWPLPYGGARDAHIVRFAEAEPAPIRRIDGAGLLRAEPLPTPVEGRELRLRDALFVDDALIFDSLRSHSLDYGVPGGRGLRIDYEGLPELGIWMKPGAGYLCIEPWAGYSDPQGFSGDIFAKPGILALAPRQQRRFTMRIALLPRLA
jgi:galactose mutarotase-like enzyme